MQRFDPTKLSFDDQFVNGPTVPPTQPRKPFTNTGFTYWDAAVGLNQQHRGREYLLLCWPGTVSLHPNRKAAFQELYHDVVLNPKW